MRASLARPVVILLVFAVALAAAGCGSDDNQAGQYMRKGDSLLPTIEEKATAWNAAVKALGADPATIAAQVQQAKALGDELAAAAGEAKAEYEKIMNLGTVSPYRDYAELRICQMDCIQQIVGIMNAFLDERAAMVASKDLSFYPPLQQKAQSQIAPISAKGQQCERDAEELKSEKRL